MMMSDQLTKLLSIQIVTNGGENQWLGPDQSNPNLARWVYHHAPN